MKHRTYTVFGKVGLLLIITALSAACDPMGVEAQPRSAQLTATSEVPTRPPTVTPVPTATPTAAPPTLAPTPTQFSCAETSGQVLDDAFDSKALGNKFHYRVYLPPCYTETNRRYPYVILLHGSDADETQWTDHMKANLILDDGIAKGTLPPMILIMPRGGETANLNVFRQDTSYEAIILNELMPTLESSLCTWGTREGRAIGGISRGGFWAFVLAFRHPDLFGAVGGHSAFFDRNNAPPDFNPLDLAKNAKFPPGMQPRIWLDAGKDDYARPLIEVFQKSLTARGIDPGYTSNPVGSHNEKYWAAHVSDYMDFYGQTWPRSVGDLPSCLE